ncbi:hypothetical protein G7B40_039995 [Aetokthonos hydrillicola Thurmond2011]|jgi:hypothetical protein|uniref:Uncharacterized protein n=1 Tax=Aetokthonos hydrillicola Thurmond2011 TaxID=2712845 RepID=A0AAP5II10_9CYAN|nr:hypothetical protein [Aetokthonos hydrillicola]MBW4590095.1 hypothetical protein [Aetokthonos hydrillicola CCALA 1050]MDR9900673.1 hypothetical protein [Aetokthonos hydrillicola Thurmond2011]
MEFFKSDRRGQDFSSFSDQEKSFTSNKDTLLVHSDQPPVPLLFREEHKQYLHSFITSTLQGKEKQALSVWAKIFPNKTERAIQQGQARIIEKKSDVQVELIEMMGDALIAEAKVHFQWQEKSCRAIVAAEHAAIIMEAQNRRMESIFKYLQDACRKYTSYTFSFLDDFEAAAERIGRVSEEMQNKARLIERHESLLLHNLEALDLFLANTYKDVRKLSISSF